MNLWVCQKRRTTHIHTQLRQLLYCVIALVMECLFDFGDTFCAHIMIYTKTKLPRKILAMREFFKYTKEYQFN